MKLVLLSGFLLAAVSAFPPSPNVQPRLSLALGVGEKEPSSKFDMDELRKRIVETSSDLWFHPPMETLPADFFIVLVQPGTPQQGVHTIESRTGSNLILAFQDRHACENFAEQLKAQNFVDPTVCAGTRDEQCGLDRQLVLTQCIFFCSYVSLKEFLWRVWMHFVITSVFSLNLFRVALI